MRVCSSAVRDALADGDMARAAALLGRPYSISGHVMHGRKLGRELGFPTLNLRFRHRKPAAMGIFVVQVHGLASSAAAGRREPRRAPDASRTPAACCSKCIASNGLPRSATQGGYGSCVRVELLHKLHDELRYDSLAALRDGIARDEADARAWFAAHAAEHARQCGPISRMRAHAPCIVYPFALASRWHAATRRQTTRDRIRALDRPALGSTPTFAVHRCIPPIGDARVPDGFAMADQPTVATRLPLHAEPARHAVPDARRPAQARAGLGEGVGRRTASTRSCATRATARRSSCCTTARRTPTASCTSATRSTRS